jgi:hypothetical protein
MLAGTPDVIVPAVAAFDLTREVRAAVDLDEMAFRADSCIAALDGFVRTASAEIQAVARLA